jgi:hypothetical protein
MAVLATLVRRTRHCVGEILSIDPSILLDRALASSGTTSFGEPQQCWHQRDAHHSTTLGMHDFRSRRVVPICRLLQLSVCNNRMFRCLQARSSPSSGIDTA